MKFLIGFILMVFCNQGLVAKQQFEKIYHGEKVEEYFPWMVSLQKEDKHSCGGIVIGSRVILTAAHCAELFDRVVFGEKLSNPDRIIKLVDGLDEIVVHYAYRSDVSEHDLAAVILHESIELTEYAQIKQNTVIDDDFVYVMGWGFTEINELSDTLLKTEMKLLDHDSCIAQFPFYESSDTVKIFEQYAICAWHETNDSCAGDSGGPLFDSENKIIGLVSFGWECGSSKPSVYTKLESYTKWISDILYLYDNKVSIIAPVISPPLQYGQKIEVPFAVKSLSDDHNYINNELISKDEYKVIHSEITVDYLVDNEILMKLNVDGVDVEFKYNFEKFHLVESGNYLYNYFNSVDNIYTTFEHDILTDQWNGKGNQESSLLVLGDQSEINLKHASSHAIILEISKPKTITWQIAVATASNDQFRIKLDGERIDEFSLSWNRGEFVKHGLFIPAGKHKIELGYYKDESGSLFSDSIALKDINIKDGNILPVDSEQYAVFYKSPTDIIVNKTEDIKVLRENEFESKSGMFNILFLMMLISTLIFRVFRINTRKLA
ncbi:MAG: serine protease [Saccharospirillaceae bacterium]|nr:serine protease [Pseudomonadales bacterium]NRB81442.1 serine protease [Saccharospirillaceae bacterium]